MSNKGEPATPVRAVFHNVATASPVIPSWMKAPEPTTLSTLARSAQPAEPSPPVRPADLTERVALPKAEPSHSDNESPHISVPAWENSSAAVDAPGGDPTGAALAELEAAVVQEVNSALQQFEAEKRAFFAEAEEKLLGLTRLIAERVIERTIENDQELLVRLVREGLGTLHAGGHVGVIVGSGFEDAAADLAARVAEAKVTVQVDPNAPTFGCRLRAELGEIDESLETRLDLIMASLESDGADEC